MPPKGRKRAADGTDRPAKKVKSATPASHPIIGKGAPELKAEALMPDGTFATVSLDDYAGKYVVLFFYPLDFTFVCPTEITQFSDRVEEFRSLGAEVLGVSIDSKFCHLAWTEQSRKQGGLGKMNIPLLADITQEIGERYKVLTEDRVALRALFLIDPSRTLRHYVINDLPVGRNVDEVLRVLQAFKYHEENGDVMPCGWKPGAKTMKASSEGLKEYCQAEN